MRRTFSRKNGLFGAKILISGWHFTKNNQISIDIASNLIKIPIFTQYGAKELFTLSKQIFDRLIFNL